MYWAREPYLESLEVRPGLERPIRVDPRGINGPTRAQARGPRWRRSSQGLYVPVTVPQVLEQRILEAAAVVPGGCAVTGWAALRWRGGRWFDGADASGERTPVTIVVGTHDIRSQPGIAVSGETVGPAMYEWVDGAPVVLATHAVSFAMRYAASDAAATLVVDLAAYSDLVSIEEMGTFLATQNSWTGIPRARRALLQAEENTWSPREFWMRHLWSTDTGLRQPLANRPVFDLHGRHLGTPDLIDAESGVVGEYDGAHHLAHEHRVSDVVRDARFRDHGLEPVVMLAGEPDSAFLSRLRGAYARAAARGGPTSWTLNAPPWWVPTHTVALRRALAQDQRRRFLRYRTA